MGNTEETGKYMTGLPRIQGQLLAYYRRLCREVGGIPSRSQIRPSNIKNILPWITMAESSGPHHMVPTLIGSAVDEVLQSSLTGINLFDIWSDEIATEMAEFYGHVLNTPCGGHLVRTIVVPTGTVKGYMSLVLPLKSDDGVVNRTIGAISVDIDTPPVSSLVPPDMVKTLEINAVTYLDTGFGIPEGALPHLED